MQPAGALNACPVRRALCEPAWPFDAHLLDAAFEDARMLGMGDAHLHWHLFPRTDRDIENYENNGRGPVWWYPMEKMYSDDNRPDREELEVMKQRLLDEL